MKRLQRSARQGADYLRTFAAWCLCALAMGVVCGGIGAGFSWCVSWASSLREAFWPWILLLLPAAGLLIVLLYRLAGLEKDPSTNLVLASIRSSEGIPVKLAPLIFIATCLTHLFGGSAGREGAALQIGGSLGNFLGRKLHLKDSDCKIVTMCGMSAVFAAIFGAPVTAMVFSMEVVSVGTLLYSAIIPCALSAVIGYGVAGLCGVQPEFFGAVSFPALDWASLLQVIAVAALGAWLSILFCMALHWTMRLGRHYLRSDFLRIALGGAAVALAMFLLAGRYAGAGQSLIEAAVAGEALPWDFALKLLLTALTIGAGFKGGEIIPGMAIGACLGCTVAPLLGMEPAFGAAVGLIAVFCGVVNCPISAILLGVELFGGGGVIFFAVAAAVSYMLSGYSSLYTGQRFELSKLGVEHIDKRGR